MRVIIQRVTSASVKVNDKLISEIGKGLLVLVGVEREDSERESELMAKKVMNLRLWDELEHPTDPDKSPRPWKRSVIDANYEVLAVSQFTLMAVTNKGRKPDFHNAMKGEHAVELYNHFMRASRKEYGEGKDDRVKPGAFGEYMEVALVNDGPITIPIEIKAQ